MRDAPDAPDALDAAPSLPSRALAVATSPILLSGLYAWSLCAAPTVWLAYAHLAKTGSFSRAVTAGVVALLAIAALVVGVALERIRHESAPLVGIWAFLGLLLTSWLGSPAAIDIARFDALRGTLGSLGFTLYALAWGVPDVFRRLVPEEHPRADTSVPLDARDALPPFAVAVAAIGIVASALVVFHAWRIHEGPRALFAHALAGLLSVALVTVSADVSVARKGHTPAPARTRIQRAASALLFLAMLGILGVSHAMLTR